MTAEQKGMIKAYRALGYFPTRPLVPECVTIKNRTTGDTINVTPEGITFWTKRQWDQHERSRTGKVPQTAEADIIPRVALP